MRKLLFMTVILLSFILIIGSCKKNVSKPDSTKIIFEGITTTDIFGQYTGFYDSTDWRQDDSWQSKEKELFTDYESYNYYCSINSNIQIVGYPNPVVHYMFMLYLVKDSSTRVDFRIVNQNFEILASYDSIYSQQIAMTFKDIITEHDSIIRIYYRLVKVDNCGFIGHGDILIK